MGIDHSLINNDFIAHNGRVVSCSSSEKHVQGFDGDDGLAEALTQQKLVR